jgi:TonB family protein
MNLSGKVVMDTIVDEAGKVEDVKTISGNPLLSAAAKKAVMQWTFTPFQRDGKPMKASVNITVNFDPSS